MTTLLASTNNFLQTLKEWDIALFVKINTEWTSSFADTLLPILRDQRTWYPLYLLLLIFLVWKLRWKAIPFILLAGLTAVFTDQISSNFLKEFVGRIRPCHEESLVGIMIQRVGYCPKSGSFTSSHAVNHFGLAAFLVFTMKPYFKQWRHLFFLWAAVICYSQIYVGVHYPGDVLGGAAIGILIGGLMAYAYRYFFNFGTPLRVKK